MLGYRIRLDPDDNDTFLITCPVLPEVTTFGETDEEIHRYAVAAIEEAIAARIARGRDLPRLVSGAKDASRSRFVKLPALTALKMLLAMALQESGVTRAELARRLKWHREQVDRLFRLDHISRIDQLEAAFNALQRDLDLGVHMLEAAE
jgi:antitoxin HicB